MRIKGKRMYIDSAMEQMRVDTINDTFDKFKKADRHYHETSEGREEVAKLIKELEKLGANMEYITEIDLQIRDEVLWIERR